MVSFFSVNGRLKPPDQSAAAMTGDARNLDGPSDFAAALDGAVVRLKDVLYRLHRAAQARLRAARTKPQPRLAGTTVIPTVRYRDVPAAIAWLCRAFGMQVHRVVTRADGAPCYAELTIGTGMLMVAPIEDTPFGKLMVQPDEIGGVETQVCYLFVANARAHYRRAKAAGAVIVLDPDDETNRGRGYSCRDPEGHVWNFGTYDPWAGQAPAPAAAGWRRWHLGRLQQGLAALVVLAVAGVLISELVPQPSARAGTAAIAPPPPPAMPVQLAIDEPRPEPAAARIENRAELRTPADDLAVEAAQRSAAEARAQLAEIRGALVQAERDAATARTQLDDLQRARRAAEGAAAEARAHLAAAQQSAEHARQEAVRERARRLAANRAATTARRRTTVNVVRPRVRGLPSWCLSPSIPSPAPSGAGRLIGFCKT
jgi:uncharacterized glyoxalase superfamily protein PhnB